MVEGDDGARRTIATQAITSVAAAATLVELPAEAAPARRVAVVFRGVDANGEPIVTSVERAAPPATEAPATE